MASSSSPPFPFGSNLIEISDEEIENYAKVAVTKGELKRKDEEIRKITEQLGECLEEIDELQIEKKDLMSQVTALRLQRMDDRFELRGPEIRESRGSHRGRLGQGHDDVDREECLDGNAMVEVANLKEINLILNSDLAEYQKLNMMLEQDNKRLRDELALLRMKIRRVDGELQKLGRGGGGPRPGPSHGGGSSGTNYKRGGGRGGGGKWKANSGGGGGGLVRTMTVHKPIAGAEDDEEIFFIPTPCPHAVPSTCRVAVPILPIVPIPRDNLGGSSEGGAAAAARELVPIHGEKNEAVAVNSIQTVPEPETHEEAPVAAAAADHVTHQDRDPGPGQADTQARPDPEPQPKVRCPHCLVTCCQPALDRHIATRHARKKLDGSR